MLSLLAGWGMMGGNPGYYGNTGPWMMGIGSYSANPLIQVLGLAYSFFLQILLVVALVALIRLLWKKGGKGCCQNNGEHHC